MYFSAEMFGVTYLEGDCVHTIILLQTSTLLLTSIRLIPLLPDNSILGISLSPSSSKYKILKRLLQRASTSIKCCTIIRAAMSSLPNP